MKFNLFRNRNFLLYALGQGISNLGSLMTFYALSLYVLEKSESSSMFAFILSVKYIPQIFLYPFSGVLVDKIERKKLLIFFDGVRGVLLTILLLIIYIKSLISMSMIYSIIFISAIIEAFYNPATNSIIPLLFDEKEYMPANSFSSWIQNVSQLVGPILGTVIYSNLDIRAVLILDAISFFSVMTFTIFLNFKNNNIKKTISITKDFKEGVNLLIHNKDLLFAVLGIGASRFFINPFYSIGLPIIIIKLLEAPAFALSIIQSFITAGTLASPVIVLWLSRHFSDAKSLMISRMGKVIPFTLLLVAGFNAFFNFLNLHMVLLVVFFSFICFLATMFNSSGFVFLNSYFQRRVPSEYLGRFASIRFMFYSIVEPLGINFFGLLYGKIDTFYPLVLVLVGAIFEAVLLSGVSEQKKLVQNEI